MEGNIDILVKELCKLPKETGWVEFKHNNSEPIMIAEDISALANTATLKDRDFAYMVWGVDDATHDIIGTSVNLPLQKRVMKNWKIGLGIGCQEMRALNSWEQRLMASI
jgi:predicted HTH transcriptional regulator